jgi:hypothetical protein
LVCNNRGTAILAVSASIGLTQALRNLGVLGSLAVTEIKLSENFCVSPVQIKQAFLPAA